MWTSDGRTIGSGERGPAPTTRCTSRSWRHTTDVSRVIASLTAPLPDGVEMHYAKQLTHHLAPDMDLGWTAAFRNVLLIRDPEGHLRCWLCDWLGIDFTTRMLTWPPGPRRSDGVWASHWYDAVWRSTGFEPWRPREFDLSPPDAAVAQACRPAYQTLHARRLRL